MKRRMSIAAALSLLAVALLAATAPANAQSTRSDGGSIYRQLMNQTGREFFDQHGYLPLHGVRAFYQAKERAAAAVARQRPDRALEGASGAAPRIGASWQGIVSTSFTPPDANGAIGPNSYVEIINSNIAVYTRTGTLVSTETLNHLTNIALGQLSDPMVLWDPHTQRFYFLVWNVSNTHMEWGFSRDANPRNLDSTGAGADWCSYDTDFGYPSGSLPDYPKLGQTTDFLMIGVNFYPNFSFLHATQSDLLWVSKPQGQAPITTCPSPSLVNSGKFEDLRNEDGTQAFTPVPAIQTDPQKYGVIVTMSDIECPDICGNGNLITIHLLRPKRGDPSEPQMLVVGRSVTVRSFTSPPDAPQRNSSDLLDTLDGRLTHAVSGLDPSIGAGTVWVAHTVMGGAGAEIRWYEINPKPVNNPVLERTGKVTSPSLYAFDAGISNDRTCTATQCAHGDATVLGFTTSSSSQFPAIQMVSKIDSTPQSGFVLVKQSTVPHNNFSCTPVCRWGDYGGATPDPAASLTAAQGRVWLTNQWTNGNDQTWNWEAIP